jgi:hypothetical protein
MTGSGSDDWISWCFFTITVNYNQYSAIADGIFQFIAAHALRFSVSIGRCLAADLSKGTIIPNQYEILSFRLRSPWNADPILQV